MTNPYRAMPFQSVSAATIITGLGHRRLVIIAPHPDDETLGCGGLIAHAVNRGIAIAVIALTDGDASHPGSARWPPTRLASLRAGEMRRALARLGAGNAAIRRLGWSDGAVGHDGCVRRLRQELIALRAGVVLVSAVADHHPDHQAAARLARTAARSLNLKVIEYGVWSRLDRATQSPGRYRQRKAWAVAAHRSQLGNYITDSADGFYLATPILRTLIDSPELFRG